MVCLCKSSNQSTTAAHPIENLQLDVEKPDIELVVRRKTALGINAAHYGSLQLSKGMKGPKLPKMPKAQMVTRRPH